jgi:hypothetical protein
MRRVDLLFHGNEPKAAHDVGPRELAIAGRVAWPIRDALLSEMSCGPKGHKKAAGGRSDAPGTESRAVQVYPTGFRSGTVVFFFIRVTDSARNNLIRDW